jgi:hypothetical protein
MSSCQEVVQQLLMQLGLLLQLCNLQESFCGILPGQLMQVLRAERHRLTVHGMLQAAAELLRRPADVITTSTEENCSCCWT